MNRVNIKRVRDVIAALPPKRFTMSFYAAEIDTPAKLGDDVSPPKLAHMCNTAGCIAGWTVASFATRLGPRGATVQGRHLLGLDDIQAVALFTPQGYATPGRYTQAHAVRVLDRLLETGEVDWVSTRRAKKPAVAK